MAMKHQNVGQNIALFFLLRLWLDKKNLKKFRIEIKLKYCRCLGFGYKITGLDSECCFFHFRVITPDFYSYERPIQSSK